MDTDGAEKLCAEGLEPEENGISESPNAKINRGDKTRGCDPKGVVKNIKHVMGWCFNGCARS